jgi:hypothetical protein
MPTNEAALAELRQANARRAADNKRRLAEIERRLKALEDRSAVASQPVRADIDPETSRPLLAGEFPLVLDEAHRLLDAFRRHDRIAAEPD